MGILATCRLNVLSNFVECCINISLDNVTSDIIESKVNRRMIIWVEDS